MDGKRLIQKIHLRNLLSFGPETEEFELQPLNVLIGPNASGKSNLIEAISLLQAAPDNLLAPIEDGGEVREWLWKGSENPPIAAAEVTVEYPAGQRSLWYRIAFGMVSQRLEIANEAIENESTYADVDEPYSYYNYHHVSGRWSVRESGGSTDIDERARPVRVGRIDGHDFLPDQSVLSQLRDPHQYPEITYMARQFEEIKFYREWNLGRNTAPRKPQSSGLPAKYLEENARNLGMVINDMVSRLQMRPLLVDYLQRFYAPITDIATLVHGGTVQLFLHEEGLNVPIPATRLSDGTLRYLCLLAVLLHPEPPPLICIEEPELGLHPDILPTIAELLIDATQRTQLIVTTHSDQLVGCLSDIPEAVVVCERDEGGTKLSRLDPEKLAKWLEDYTLDQLWSMGEIGGNPQ